MLAGQPCHTLSHTLKINRSTLESALTNLCLVIFAGNVCFRLKTPFGSVPEMEVVIFFAQYARKSPICQETSLSSTLIKLSTVCLSQVWWLASSYFFKPSRRNKRLKEV